MQRIFPLPGDRATVVILTLGAFGGVLGAWAGLPAGVMVGAMLAVAAGRLLGAPYGLLPTTYRRIGRVLLGATVGATFTPGVVESLGGLLLPTVFMIAAMVLAGVGVGLFLHRAGQVDLTTALFASAPGGMSEMAAAADEAGGNASLVATIHLLRIVVVVVTVPLITLLLEHLRW